jgi:HEAT repeat protein
MPQPVSCTCFLHDDTTVEERQIEWDGPTDFCTSISLPERMTPGSSITLPGLEFAPSSGRVRVRCDVSDDIDVHWSNGQSDVDGTTFWLDPEAPTTCEATFRSPNATLERPREAAIRLTFENLVPQRWFDSFMWSATALLTILGFLSAEFVGGITGTVVMFVCWAVAVAVTPHSIRTITRGMHLPLPVAAQYVGTISLPPIRIEPLITRSDASNEHVIGRYCERLADRMSRVSILGLASPIDLDAGFVPVSLQLRTGAVVTPEMPQEHFTQVDRLLDTDLQLKRLFSGEEIKPEDAWQRFSRLAIIGDAGTGKTTLLQRLSSQLGRGPLLWKISIPVFVELHRLALRMDLHDDPLGALRSSIVEAIISEITPDPQDEDAEPVDNQDLESAEEPADEPEEPPDRETIEAIVDSLIDSGELTLFLDGLDEVSGPPNEEERLVDSTLAAISAASKAWNARMVVTCRRASMDRYRRLPEGFTVAETLPFNTEGIEHFVKSYFSNTPHHAQRLLYELERTPRVAALASTPLLLALITLIFEQRGSLPQRRAEIYRRCAILLLQEWDSLRQRTRYPRFQLEHKEDFLRKISWYLHTNGLRYISREELLTQLHAFLPTIGLGVDVGEELLHEVTTHHGLLRAYEDDWYGLIHFAMQEHFTADCIGSRETLDTVISQRHRAWWQEIIRLYAGIGDSTDLVRRLLGEPEDLFRTNLRLAGEAMAEGASIDPELREYVFTELLRIAREMRVPRLNVSLWRVLAMNTDSANAEPIWQAVRDERMPLEVRTSVIQTMQSLSPDEFAGQAITLLSDEPLSPEVQVALISLAASSHAQDVYEALSEIAASSEYDHKVRAAAVEGLAQVAGHDAIPVLRELLILPDCPTEVRREIAIVLRDAGVRGLTLQILDTLNDWHVETAVRSSLASIVGELGEVRALTGIVEALTNTRLPSAVRSNLALSLKTFHDPGLAVTLVKLLQVRDLDYAVRLAIADALSHVATESHREIIKRIYTGASQEDPIRVRLAVALGSLGDVGVTSALLHILGDRAARPYLRLEASRVLGSSESPEISDVMLGMIDSRTADMLGQELAVIVLGMQGNPQAAVPLVERLADAHLPQPARVRMADILAVIGGEDIVDRMVSLLDDRGYDSELRGRLALTLTHLTDARSDRALERVRSTLTGIQDVTETMTLAWHLSEQVGVAIYPYEIGLEPFDYDLGETGPPTE